MEEDPPSQDQLQLQHQGHQVPQGPHGPEVPALAPVHEHEPEMGHHYSSVGLATNRVNARGLVTDSVNLVRNNKTLKMKMEQMMLTRIVKKEIRARGNYML